MKVALLPPADGSAEGSDRRTWVHQQASESALRVAESTEKQHLVEGAALPVSAPVADRVLPLTGHRYHPSRRRGVRNVPLCRSDWYRGTALIPHWYRYQSARHWYRVVLGPLRRRAQPGTSRERTDGSVKMIFKGPVSV